MQFNEAEVRKAISVLIGPGEVFECRIVGESKQQPSGYFSDTNTFVECLKKQNLKNANVYIVLNKLKKECYGREQRNCFLAGKVTASDNDILTREWILIDLDPERPRATSATDTQVLSAKKKATDVYRYLKNQGFPDPVIAFSGNGYHLLYKVSMLNSKENKDLVERFLKAMDGLFSDEANKCRTVDDEDESVMIDKSVFNAGRICKLYGTMAQKGANTELQPHRMSKITYVPNEIIPVDESYIKKIANSIIPQEVVPSRYNNYNTGSFDIEEWMQKYGIGYKPVSYSGGTKYILDHCPFDSTHKGKDAAIFKMSNGAIAFKCFHNSCSDKTWRDVRLLFEPDAYSRKWEDQRKVMYGSNNKSREVQVRQIEVVDEEPVFMTAQQILDKPAPPESFIKTGIDGIDKKMRGLKKGHVSIWSGLRGSAKSTVLSQITLTAVDNDNTAIVYSGELNSKSFMRWMNQQAAGHRNEPSAFEGYYNTPLNLRKEIAEWLSDKFYLYNNYYGNNFEEIINKVGEQVDKTKADFVILDNLMSFNIASLGNTKWDAQSAFVWKLHDMAMKQNIHIAFVAHPKKAAGFLRFDDISGTADLGNAVDDAFIVHRVNEDFKRLSQEMFKWKLDDPKYESSNVIEIVKDRDGGTQDFFIPLYFEVRSRRLKNSPEENVVYGWEKDSDGFMDIQEEMVFDD